MNSIKQNETKTPKEEQKVGVITSGRNLPSIVEKVGKLSENEKSLDTVSLPEQSEKK